MRAGSRWRIRATIPVRCKPTLGTRTSSIPSATLRRPNTLNFGVLLLFVKWIGPGIINPNDSAGHSGTSNEGSWPRRNHRSPLDFEVGRNEAISRREPVNSIVQLEDYSPVRAAKPGCHTGYTLQDGLQFEFGLADNAQHLCRCFLLLKRLVPLTFEQRNLRIGAGTGRVVTHTDLRHTGALCLCRRASPVFHGIAVCCGRAHSGHAAAARRRIPENSRRFMTAPGSGHAIVSAQTDALEELCYLL